MQVLAQGNQVAIVAKFLLGKRHYKRGIVTGMLLFYRQNGVTIVHLVPLLIQIMLLQTEMKISNEF